MNVRQRIATLREQGLDDAAVRTFLDDLDAHLEREDPILALVPILKGLADAVDEVQTLVSDEADRDAQLKTARRQFAIQLSALLLDDNFPGDGEALSTVRKELQEVATRLGGLVEQSILDRGTRDDLAAASAVQGMLLPSTTSVAGLEVAAWFQPADGCAGDWWTIAPLGDSDALVCIGDVTGHGAASAMVSALVKGAVDLARLGMRGALKPFQLLRMLNRVVAESLHGEYLMTGVFCRYNRESGLMALANAGHRSVWHFRKGKVTVLPGTGAPPLGAREVFRYEEQMLQLQSGDRLVLFTDGIPECENAEGEEYGERPLREVLEASTDASGADAVDAVRDAIATYMGADGIHTDDLTLVVIDVA